MKRIICTLPEDLYESLRKKSFEKRKSMAELIRTAVKEELLKESPSVLSEPSLKKIWENEEDSVYDKL
jgi:hypothetical protein